MQVGMVLAIAAMRMEHHDVATPERLASDLTVEVITPPQSGGLDGCEQPSGLPGSSVTLFELP